MIHILCLNPTIDRMYYIDSFLPGFQYHGNKAEIYPGGKGLNILRVLRKLQNSNTTSKDESLCNAIDNALNLLIEADLVL